MSKFLFIEPKAPNLHIFSDFKIPRLGNLVLATMARQHGWDAEVIVEEVSGIDDDPLPAADIVGISTITSTAPRAYEIADAYRRRGVRVLMGGPHVSFMPDEAMEHADYIVRGEGETPFLHFLTALEEGDGWEDIPNFSFRIGEDVCHNNDVPLVSNLTGLPIPDLSLVRSFMGRFVRRVVPVETSRGCPFNCTFCNVARMFGRRMRYRPIEETVEELRRQADVSRFIFFVDDNFAASPARTKQLLQAVIDANLNLKWSAQVRCDAAKDEELLELMQRSGCGAVYVGIESINPQTLERIRKKQKIEEVSLAIQNFHRYKIRVHGMFIFGFDEDNKSLARNTWRYAKHTKLNSAQFLILTPLPGTEMFDQLQQQKRILTDDWSFYDAHHVVFRPKAMRPIDLQKLQIKAHEKFYSLVQQIRWLFRFEFFEFAIANYANRINRRWKRVNRFFMSWLKKLSDLKDKALSGPPSA